MTLKPSKYRVLVACEHTGAMAALFHNAGYNVLSCDIKAQVCPWKHHCGDVLSLDLSRFDAMVAFPPCTYLAKAQWHRCLASQARMIKCFDAVQFVIDLYERGPNITVIENPSGMLSKFWRSPDGVIYPYQFGDPYRKEINLWVKGVSIPAPKSRLRTGKPIDNHVNGRMSQERKSEIKSSWLFYPNTCRALFEAVDYSLTRDLRLF